MKNLKMFTEKFEALLVYPDVLAGGTPWAFT